MSENKITKRSDLFREYARVIDMTSGTKTAPCGCVKCMGLVMYNQPSFDKGIDDYEFALAIVEDRPVFKGDVLWTKDGNKVTIQGRIADALSHCKGTLRIDCLTWQEPKRTITINGKEYPAPKQDQKTGVGCYLRIRSTKFWFNTMSDVENVHNALLDLLNGK